MDHSMFNRVVVPVANREDAEATTASLAPYVDDSDRSVIAVHVIEKAGGAPDKASVEQRKLNAEDIFSLVADGLNQVPASLTTQLHYGTDIAATLIEVAHDVEATAIVFTPRGGSLWRKLLTGDVTHNLVRHSDIPVIVLPDREERNSS